MRKCEEVRAKDILSVEDEERIRRPFVLSPKEGARLEGGNTP